MRTVQSKLRATLKKLKVELSHQSDEEKTMEGGSSK